jgi:exodeoxyribonuclease VII large subunit
MPISAARVLTQEKHRLELLSQRLESLNPELLLRRGYSITMMDGRIVTDISDIKPEAVLTTMMQGGEVTSKVLKTETSIAQPVAGL